MRKLVVGLFVALVVGAGAYFGAVYWAERTAARQVDVMLDRWRSGGGTATRGRVAFDLWTRTVRVADVALKSASSPDEWIAIGEVVATDIDPSGRARRVDIVGLEASHALPGPAGARLQQKAPRVTLTDFSERPVARTRGASPVDAMRRWLEQFRAITASSIEAPSLVVAVTRATGSSGPGLAGAAEYTYSNLVLRDVADGRIAEATVDGVAFRANAGRTGQGVTGEVAKASVRDIDMAPVLAWLDPSRPKDQGYQRVYGHLVAGPYTVRFADGTGIGVDQVVAEEIGLRPAKLSLDDLVFLMEVSRPGMPPPTPAQIGMLVEKTAGIYEGLRLGRLEIQGLRLATTSAGIGTGVSIARVALDGFDNGRLAEVSIEGLDGQKGSADATSHGGMAIEKRDGRTPVAEPLKVGRATLKGLHIANLLRASSTQLVSAGPRAAGPDPMLAMLSLLEGLELRDVAVPEPRTGRVVHVEALDASWRHLVEGIPSETRLSARLSGPIAATDPDAFVRALVARGMTELAASVDIGARWNEAERSVVLAPATLEIRDVLALSIKASAGQVPREMLSTDILKMIGSAPLVEAGPVELALRDLGVVEIAAAQLGLAKGGDAEAGRAALAELVAQWATKATQTAPELQPVFDALTRLVQGRGETLTVALTPKGSVGLMQFVEAARRDGVAALLANFTVDVRTGG
jgi:hypothetical protein